ncbi:unnamed protein product [Phaedon cochleariae]|uniref:Uncharacterized protein n=1 Tax=Phaedon cochleariae TaxID=80249 RepID=A0A9N9X524_PHACE|nr:unnamed protein product [Phaedon cochleariae]
MKTDFTKAAADIENLSHQPLKYSDVLKDKSQPAIIIRPKSTNQTITQTKSEILRNIDPTAEQFQLAKVKSVKDGGILIGCKNKADNEKLMQMVKQKMSNSYDVKELLLHFRRVNKSRYEEEQQKLQNLLQECFSDEEDMNHFEPDGTSDEFEPESDDDSDSDSIKYQPRKKKKVSTKISGSKRNTNLHQVKPQIYWKMLVELTEDVV